MKSRHAVRLTAALLTMAVGLAACSTSEKKGPARLAADQLVALVRPAPEGVDARTVLTAERLAASPGSVLLVVQEEGDNAFTVNPVAANLGTVEWRGAGGVGLAQRGGILVGTRGFGFDLMTADIEPLSQALVAGGGRDLQRINRVLIAGKMVQRSYLCDVVPQGSETLTYYGRSFPTSVYDESCVGTDGDNFVNRYWLSPNGAVRRSRERVSPEIGVFEIVRLTE